MRTRITVPALLALLLFAAVKPSRAAQTASIVVASTTSTQDSGFFSYLVPIVRSRIGVELKVVALGTGQALDTARRGDADVVFVHDPDAERRFVAEGQGVKRHPVMYNDFLIVGPSADPAQVRGKTDAAVALRAIAAGGFPFVSRGDRSGTHQAELRLWNAARVAIDAVTEPWYRSVGQGMGPALNIASASDSYVLTDRATWVQFGNRGTLQALVQGDPRLFNQYGLIVVNPAKHPHVNAVTAQRFVDFMLSAQGQSAIAAYRVNGEQLFHPNATSASSR